MLQSTILSILPVAICLNLYVSQCGTVMYVTGTLYLFKLNGDTSVQRTSVSFANILCFEICTAELGSFMKFIIRA